MLGKTFIISTFCLIFNLWLIIGVCILDFLTDCLRYLSSFSSLSSFVTHYLVFKVQLIECYTVSCVGGDEEDRTPDPLLARQVLSQLSYTPKFPLILRQDCLGIQPYSLRCLSLSEWKLLSFSVSPIWLLVILNRLCFFCDCRVCWYAIEQKNNKLSKLVGLSGLEPPTSRLSGVRSNRLSYRPIGSMLDSNLFFPTSYIQYSFIQCP